MLMWPRGREEQHAAERYLQWQKLREKAQRNVPGGKLPEGFKEVEHPPPPPSSVMDDNDIMDLSMVLSTASIIDDLPCDFDESGLEEVPTADPGLDVSAFIDP